MCAAKNGRNLKTILCRYIQPFFRISLDGKSKPYTVVIVPDGGLYQCKRLLVNLSNSPTTSHWLIDWYNQYSKQRIPCMCAHRRHSYRFWNVWVTCILAKVLIIKIAGLAIDWEKSRFGCKGVKYRSRIVSKEVLQRYRESITQHGKQNVCLCRVAVRSTLSSGYQRVLSDRVVVDFLALSSPLLGHRHDYAYRLARVCQAGEREGE